MNRLFRVVVVALSCALAAPALAQTTGRLEGVVVTDGTRRPIPNVTVNVPGVNVGTQTNEQGRYALVNVPVGTQQVQFRRLGFQSRTTRVNVLADRPTTLDIALTEAAVSLDEMVVTGTAVVTRAREVPTSTDIVNADEFENLPVLNAQDALVGRVPSLSIQANSGQPGAGGSIKIRGTNTITQSTDPLIYVDGVRIFNETTRNNWGARTGSNPLQNINSDDIERMEVVKGAAATTLYGTEASAGVIQIFTKKGMAGQPRWSMNVTEGFNASNRWGSKDDPSHLFIECGGLMYSLVNSGSRVGQKEYFRDPTCPSDGTWTQAGPIQEYGLSLRGGNQKITYYASGNYGDNQGILPTQRSADGGFRGNFTFAPIDRLQFNWNSGYTRRNTRSVGDGNNAEGFLLNVGRGSKNYMKGGKGNDCDSLAGTDTVCVTNGYVFDQTLTTRMDHFLSGVTASWIPNEKLSNRLTVGWDFTDFQNVTNLPFGFLTLDEGYFWDENSRHTKLSLDYASTLQTSLNVGPSLVSKLSWGGQVFRDRHRWTEIDVQRFAGPGDPTLTTGAELTYRNDLPSATTSAGFFGQEEMGWRDRLFLNLGLRVDGHSAFGDDFGLQTYPKVGLSYVLSEHEFWPKNWFDSFKLRGAIGESGKAPGAFDKLRTWSPVTGDENKPGFTPGNVGNAELGPERTREMEGGFDASFLSGRVGLEFSAYQARTFDALVPVTLPPSNGFLQSRLTNLGELRNSGIELQATTTLYRGELLDWRARANYASQRSKAVDLGEQTEVYTGLNSYIKAGERFPAYYGKRVLNPTENAAPVIANDTIIGLVNPNKLWGVGSSLGIGRNLSLDVFFDHQGGFVVQDYTAYQNARRGSWYPCYDVQQKIAASYGADKRLGTADDVASALDGVPALQRARCAFIGHDIGFWTEKGDFTKLRYISLSYVIPPRLLQAHDATVTFSARNLFTWTDYQGSDPEMQDVVDQSNLVGNSGRFGRRDYYQIPQPRTFTMMVRTTF